METIKEILDTRLELRINLISRFDHVLQIYDQFFVFKYNTFNIKILFQKYGVLGFWGFGVLGRR